MRAVWKPLIVDRAWNAELRAAATDASGAYVVRRKADRVVLYVGMSETGHLWRTMTRHFHDWKALPKHFWSADGTRLVRGKETFQHARPELLEAALFVTSVRRRTKHTPDRLARNLEADLIARYQPIVNLDPGHAWDDRDATRAVRRRGKHGASPASEEPVPEAEVEDDAAEPEVYEDTSDDPDDPFAVRNPAHALTCDMDEDCSCRANPAPAPAQRAQAHVPRTASAEKPEGYLVELGKLTAIEASSRVGGAISSAKWSPRSAPILAYDLRGRLFIVYTDGTTTRAARGSEKSRYKATHWGQEGRGELRSGAIVTGSCKVWGVGTRITYTTKKGEDRELVDYVHEWGEGATGEWEAPLVVSHGTRYALAGGTYRVDTRGIVG